MLQERWLPWKVGLYGFEVVSSWGRYFWTGGLVYDNYDIHNKNVMAITNQDSQ